MHIKYSVSGLPHPINEKGEKIMKKNFILTAVLLSVLLVIGANAVNETAIARLHASVVSVDNKGIVFYTYKIENQEYFKLRDVAYILSSTEKKFEVEWDSETNSITITGGKPYAAIGAEMAVTDRTDKTVTKALAQVYCDGELHKFDSYFIEDNYYFALPDLASALDIDLTYDGKKYLIYTEKAPILLEKTDDKGQEYIDKIIFMGDSTTNGLLAYKMLPGGRQSTQVWVPSDKTFSLFNQKNILIEYPETNENISVEKAVSLKMPEYMVITLGVNGVASMNEEDFKKHYKELIGRILEANPETKIMLNSIYPVAKNYGNLDKINNAKIDRANRWIYELAEELDMRFLDTNSVLKDKDGWLPYNYQNGDGLHLAPAAYTIILDYIRTHAYR